MNRSTQVFLLVLVVVQLVVAHVYYPRYYQSTTEASISWDVSGYYFYLPALFIDGDLKTVPSRVAIHKKYQPASTPYQTFTHDQGVQVMKYSAGMAILYLPAFAIAHSIALHSAYAADGFSRPYQIAIHVQSSLVAALGVVLLGLLLGQFFSGWPLYLTTIAIVLGSNYLDYATINACMTHNYLFTGHLLLLFCTWKAIQSPSNIRYFLAAGMCVGLMTLIRPSELLSILVLPLLAMGDWSGYKTAIRWGREHAITIATYLLPVIGIPLVQLFYWHYITGGEWLVYSYQDQGFDFLRPHIWQGLFSYRAGWLLYSPIMALSILGYFAIGKTSASSWRVLIITYPLLHGFVTLSWNEWWYGASLGQRAMIHVYPLLALSMAALFQTASRNWRLRFWVPIVTLLTLYNLFLTHQAHIGGRLVPGEMDGTAFWGIFVW